VSATDAQRKRRGTRGDQSDRRREGGHDPGLGRPEPGHPVTVVRVSPARVVQVKTPEKEGYSAVQVTWGTRRISTLSKPELGHFEKAGVTPGKKLVELRLDDVSGYSVARRSSRRLEKGEMIDATASPRERVSPVP